MSFVGCRSHTSKDTWTRNLLLRPQINKSMVMYFFLLLFLYQQPELAYLERGLKRLRRKPGTVLRCLLGRTSAYTSNVCDIAWINVRCSRHKRKNLDKGVMSGSSNEETSVYIWGCAPISLSPKPSWLSGKGPSKVFDGRPAPTASR